MSRTEMTTVSHVAVDQERPRPHRRAARQGIGAMLPLVVGYVPFALVIGATAADLGHPVAGWAGSWLVYGGSAHLATLTTLDDGLAAAVATGLLINARLLVYSASLGRRWASQPTWFRLTAAALVIDPTWAVVERDVATERDDREQRWFFLGAELTLGLAWSTAIAIGAMLGARIDAVDRRTALVIVSAAAVALATSSWPAGTGLLAAVVVGTLVGLILDRQDP
jgi:predicted branched-subunit amino acid permease